MAVDEAVKLSNESDAGAENATFSATALETSDPSKDPPLETQGSTYNTVPKGSPNTSAGVKSGVHGSGRSATTHTSSGASRDSDAKAQNSPDASQDGISQSQTASLDRLQSDEHRQLLDMIDKVRRSAAVSRNVDLPQIVVCGDTSCGKSSLLEAISGVRFPINGGVCTRFVTELVLRHSHHPFSGKAMIQAGKDSSSEHRARLTTFNENENENVAVLGNIDPVIKAAEKAMQIHDSKRISNDVLSLNFSGPNMPDLTLVDVPGLIHSERNENDGETVRQLVKHYMDGKRSIILAVVAANNELENQKVLALARRADATGARTIGVITKPDLLELGNKISSEAILRLAQNADTQWQTRQWHVLRNPTPSERSGEAACPFYREQAEDDLSSLNPWRHLPSDSLGLNSLIKYLQKSLFELVRTEIGPVIKEVDSKIKHCQIVEKRLGTPRSTRKEQLDYLGPLSQEYHRLVYAAFWGNYQNTFFAVSEKRRLRSQMQHLNYQFEWAMRMRGHAYEMDRESASPSKPRDENLPELVTRQKFMEKMNKLITDLKGIELDGMFNPTLVIPAFREQSGNWRSIADKYANFYCLRTKEFLREVLHSICAPGTSTAEVLWRELFHPAMEQKQRLLAAKIDEILAPYINGVPFASRHRFAANCDLVKGEDAYTPSHANSDGVLAKTISNYQAAVQLSQWSRAYYSYAIENFIDNFVTLAIDNCLLAGIEDIFTPMVLSNLGDEKIQTLGGEPSAVTRERVENSKMLSTLLEAKMICEQHRDHEEELQEGLVNELPEEMRPRKSES